MPILRSHRPHRPLRSPDAAATAAVAVAVRERRDLPAADTWKLDDIFPSWDAWEQAFATLEQSISAYAQRLGTLARGAASLLDALQASDELGQLAY
jgi:oligoendopeptidase F